MATYVVLPVETYYVNQLIFTKVFGAQHSSSNITGSELDRKTLPRRHSSRSLFKNSADLWDIEYEPDLSD